MSWLNNVKISTKLISTFIVVALIAVIVGGVGIYWLKSIETSDTEMYENMTSPLADMAHISQAFERIRGNVRDMILSSTDAQFADFSSRIVDRDAEIKSFSEDFKKRILSTEMQTLFDTFQKDYTDFYNKVNRSVIPLAMEGKDDQAYALVLDSGDVGVIEKKVQSDIIDMITKKEKDASAKSENNSSNANMAVIIMVVVMAIGSVFAVILGVILSRSISKPVIKLKDAADKLALGDVEVDIDHSGTDEVGQLMVSFRKMVGNIKEQAEAARKIAAGDINISVKPKSDKDILAHSMGAIVDTLKNLLDGMQNMSKQHDLGDIDVIVPEEKFEGSYKVMAKGVNDMVMGHISVKKKAMACVAEFSKGNFDAELEKFPGKKVFINDNLEALRKNLKEVNKEVNNLINATIDGRLTVRANSQGFTGDWDKLIKGLNGLVDAFVNPINVTSDYIDRISKGNIPAKITDTYNGDFNVIKNNLNTCIEAINALVADSNMLSKAAVEGKLSTRADASKHGGDFAKIVDGVNKTLDAVIEPVKEASEVLQEMAKGNLHVNVKGNYMGDHADIKDALNLTINTILGYVSEISNVLTEMANSNLNVSITSDYRGDFNEIKESLNLIIQSFNEVMGEIGNSADQVASGSRQVSDGSQALSQGSTEQASSIEELSSSITQIAAQTKQNAVNANQANELSMNAKDNAVNGNDRMKEMLKAMVEINDSSTSISKIIKVIDEIAFQTNILALNAAVEAARAGQHGKGFAVVAEEVRNLAARSANAAKETTAMIEGSIKKVEAGTRIANDTAEALVKIVNGVEKATNLVGSIASASNEQATAIAQINKGIEQVSTVVQSNSATAEQSAAASEELSSQSSLLKEMVSKFILKNSGSMSATPANSRAMLESGDKRPGAARGAKVARSEAAATKQKISLNSIEFGKY